LASDVGDADALAQLRVDPVEGRNPVLDEVREVARPEEARDAVEELVVVLVPADAFACAERVGELGEDAARRDRRLEGADDERRAVGVREHQRLLGRELVAAAAGVVIHVAGGRLRIEPLAHVALARIGVRRKPGGRHRPLRRQRAIQSEPVADDHQRSGRYRAEVYDRAAQQVVKLLLVDSCSRHGHSLRRWRSPDDESGGRSRICRKAGALARNAQGRVALCRASGTLARASSL
jgi:hypothetical protein